MNEKATMSKVDVEALLNGLNDYIAQAKEILERGDYLELEGLDDQVKALCDSVMSLQVEESLSFADELDATMKELDGLQALFMESRDQLADDMQGVGKHKQAAMAYKQSETAPHREGFADPHADESE